ncbi:MAG: hypothetical protein LBG84_04650 [Treponema sp.]|jgi:hypothetical protein|nr:hypothetical protein [Treponema sp.]
MGKRFLRDFRAPRGVIFAALFMMVCAAAFAQKTESWAKIRSSADLAGSWEGSQTMEVPRNDEAGVPQSVLLISFTLNYVRGGENVDMKLKMNFNQLLEDWVLMPQMKQVKFTKDQIWLVLVEMLSNMMGEVVEFDDGYNMLYTMSGPVDSLMSDGSVMINRNKTKLKLTFDEPMSLGLGDEGFTEMILDKKKNETL